jgi:hypothetical protein
MDRLSVCGCVKQCLFCTCAHNCILAFYTHRVRADKQNMIFVPKDPDREERARRKSSAHAYNAQVISQLAATRQQMDIAIALAQRRRSSSHATDSELLVDLPSRGRKYSSRRTSGAGDRSAGSATGDTSATSACTPSTPAKKSGGGFWANLFGRSSARGRTQSTGGGSSARRQKKQVSTTMSTGQQKMNRRNKNAGNTTVRSKSAEAIVEVCHMCKQCLHSSI